MDLDGLAEWLERHPEIAEITLTEVVTTTVTGPQSSDDVLRYE